MLPFPDSFPVLGDVVAGDDGRVWVRGYRPPVTDSAIVEAAPALWHVYAGPGGEGRAIAFPAGFDLLWADGEEAVGVVRDAFDVEQVVVLPLPAAARRESRAMKRPRIHDIGLGVCFLLLAAIAFRPSGVFGSRLRRVVRRTTGAWLSIGRSGRTPLPPGGVRSGAAATHP